jgi:hypothetical protein
MEEYQNDLVLGWGITDLGHIEMLSSKNFTTFKLFVKVKVELLVCLIKHHAMKTDCGMETRFHSGLDGQELPASGSSSYIPGETVPCTHCIRAWMGLRDFYLQYRIF